MGLKKIENRIQRIKEQLLEIGEMRPGSISKQYSVCGSKGCKCKDPEKPKKHGPYTQLSFVRLGKSTSRFIRPHQVQDVKLQLAQYKRFRKLMDDWLSLAIENAEFKLLTTKDVAQHIPKGDSAKEK